MNPSTSSNWSTWAGMGFVLLVLGGLAVMFYPREEEEPPPPAGIPVPTMMPTMLVADIDTIAGPNNMRAMKARVLPPHPFATSFHTFVIQELDGKQVYKLRLTADGDEVVIDAQTGKLLSPAPTIASTEDAEP